MGVISRQHRVTLLVSTQELQALAFEKDRPQLVVTPTESPRYFCSS